MRRRKHNVDNIIENSTYTNNAQNIALHIVMNYTTKNIMVLTTFIYFTESQVMCADNEKHKVFAIS